MDENDVNSTYDDEIKKTSKKLVDVKNSINNGDASNEAIQELGRGLLTACGLGHLLIVQENLYNNVINYGWYSYKKEDIIDAIDYFVRKEEYEKCEKLKNVLNNVYLKNLGS